MFIQSFKHRPDVCIVVFIQSACLLVTEMTFHKRLQFFLGFFQKRKSLLLLFTFPGKEDGEGIFSNILSISPTTLRLSHFSVKFSPQTIGYKFKLWTEPRVFMYYARTLLMYSF